MLAQIYFHVNAKYYIKNRKLKFYIVGQTRYATRCISILDILVDVYSVEACFSKVAFRVVRLSDSDVMAT